MDFTKLKCPVCAERFKEEDDIVVCPKCGAPYHRECYAVKGKCIFPELHKSGESWHSEEAEEPSEPFSENESDGQLVCRHCGHKNSIDSIVCEKCGDFLTSPRRKTPDLFGSSDDSEEEDEDGFGFSASNVFQGGRISMDTIREITMGVKKDDDFDGVSGEELMAFVGKNELYYGPIFTSIKKINTSRLNFASMFFFGVWHIFRKQYVKGILLSLLYFVPFIADHICSRFFGAAELWKNAKEALSASSAYVDYQMYISWIRDNCSFTQGLVMLLPMILNFLCLVLMVVACFRSNRSYYRFCLKKVKKIKAENSDAEKEHLLQVLKEKGGTNFGFAFMILACESILAAAFLMI